MTGPREPKKSESIEVRLPYEVKSALMDKAHAEGRSASAVIRSSIDGYLAGRDEEKPNMLITAWKPIAVATATAVAVAWSALSPAPLAAGPDFRAAFNSLDRNKDGVVTLAEFDQVAGTRGFTAHAMTSAALPAGHPPIASGQKLDARHAGMLKTAFAKEDLNHDGAVSFDEFESYHVGVMNSTFAKIDTNKDGVIEPAEIGAFEPGVPAAEARSSFAQLDANRDGKITKSEFFAGMK